MRYLLILAFMLPLTAQPALEDVPHLVLCGADGSRCTQEQLDTEWEKAVKELPIQANENAAKAARNTFCTAGLGLKIGTLARFLDAAKVEWVASAHPTWCYLGTHCIIAAKAAQENRVTDIGCVPRYKQGAHDGKFIRGRFKNKIVTDPASYNPSRLLVLESIPADWVGVE